MMKVVAAALVLIAGAAVVLWFGNTLNSLVLGGLIGGLAAILLSVPISLTLFSYLSRRHDEQLRAESEFFEEDAYAQMYEYEDVPVRAAREVPYYDGYALEAGQEEFWNEEEEYSEEYYQPQRALPRQAQRSLPASARFSDQGQPMNRLPSPRQNERVPLPKPTQKNTQRGKEAGRRTTRQMNNPGFPGYQPGSMMRSQKSAALRAARLEMVQQDNEVEELPTYTSSRLSSLRSEREMTGQYEQLPRPRRSTRQLSQRDQQMPPQRSRRFVEATSQFDEFSQPQYSERGTYYREDPETENLSEDRYPRTDSLRRPTSQSMRRMSDNQDESPSGSIKRPLQRRAPYMYEDDPLREELSQQLRPPTVRRSSRLEPRRFDEEE